MKGKGEKERYTNLNAEFQRIARRDKKVFFSDQCKEIEENNRMGKTRDQFKVIPDSKYLNNHSDFYSPHQKKKKNNQTTLSIMEQYYLNIISSFL